MEFPCKSLLGQLLAPMSFLEFEKNIFKRAPVAFQSQAMQFRKFISWAVIEDILFKEHENSWLPRQGRLPPDGLLNTGKISFQDAVQAYQQGRSVVLRHAEKCNSAIAEIAMDFHQVFASPTDVQIYVSPPEERHLIGIMTSKKFLLFNARVKKSFSFGFLIPFRRLIGSFFLVN